MLIFDCQDISICTVLRTLYHVRTTLRSLYGMRHESAQCWSRCSKEPLKSQVFALLEVNVRCRKSASLPTNRNTQFSLFTRHETPLCKTGGPENQCGFNVHSDIPTLEPPELRILTPLCRLSGSQIHGNNVPCAAYRFQTLVLRTHHDQSPYTEATKCTLPSSVA